MSAAGIIETLWNSIDRKNLSDEQIEYLCRFSGQSVELSNLAEVMTGIGCMISTDGNQTGNQAGNFQDSDSVSQFLWVLADAVKTSASVCYVLSEARAIRDHRRELAEQQGGKPARKVKSPG